MCKIRFSLFIQGENIFFCFFFFFCFSLPFNAYCIHCVYWVHPFLGAINIFSNVPLKKNSFLSLSPYCSLLIGKDCWKFWLSTQITMLNFFSLQINTCNSFYCDQFTPNSPNKPKMWTENWPGWYCYS